MFNGSGGGDCDEALQCGSPGHTLLYVHQEGWQRGLLTAYQMTHIRIQTMDGPVPGRHFGLAGANLVQSPPLVGWHLEANTEQVRSGCSSPSLRWPCPRPVGCLRDIDESAIATRAHASVHVDHVLLWQEL